MAIQHQALKISISEMLRNPTGKNTAYFAARSRVKAQLDTIFIQNLRKYRKAFYAVPYVDDNTRNIVYYVRVPSGDFLINRISYDCIVEIEYDSTKSLENRNAKFYTNSPEFIFTYAYVFNAKDLIPDFIKSKMPQQCLTVPPTTKNPVETLGFSKILYQALKYLTVGGCLTDRYIDFYKQRLNTITKADLTAKCADTNTLISVYQHAKRLDALKRNKNKKPVSTQQKNAMTTEAKQFQQFRKANAPNYVGTIIKRAPRSAITARKVESKYVRRISSKKPRKY